MTIMLLKNIWWVSLNFGRSWTYVGEQLHLAEHFGVERNTSIHALTVRKEAV